jgi:hypothetical protein
MENKNSAFQLVVVALLALLVGVVSTVLIVKSFDGPKISRNEKKQMLEQNFEPEEKEIVAQKEQISCAQNWDLFAGENFSFCHDQKWGAIEQSEIPSLQGKLYRIEFANSRVLEDNQASTAPSIWWESTDLMLNDGGSAQTCFDCVDFSQDEDELLEILVFEGDKATLQKTTINSKKAVRIHYDTAGFFDIALMNRVQYLIPNAFENHHFQVSISGENAAELDEMMKTLVFKD